MIEERNIMKLQGDRPRDRLHWKRLERVPRPLVKPRLECGDVACKEYRGDGIGRLTTIYKSICQDPYYLINAPHGAGSK